MKDSYLILDEYMRFLNCTGGRKDPSRSILDVGVEEAIKFSGFDEKMFLKRGGKYVWSKADLKLDWWVRLEGHSNQLRGVHVQPLFTTHIFWLSTDCCYWECTLCSFFQFDWTKKGVKPFCEPLYSNGLPQGRSSVHRGTRSSDPKEPTFHLYLNFCVDRYCESHVSFSLSVPPWETGLFSVNYASFVNRKHHKTHPAITTDCSNAFLLWNLRHFAQKYRIKTCAIEPYVRIVLFCKEHMEGATSEDGLFTAPASAAAASRMAVLYRTNSFKVLDKAKVHFTFHGMAVKIALTQLQPLPRHWGCPSLSG